MQAIRRLSPPAAALLALAAVPAFAQGPLAARLKALDSDGDGAISREEMGAALHTQFAALDRNHDGVLSEDEFVAARMALFTQSDSDGDGKLTRSELREHLLAMRQQP